MRSLIFSQCFHTKNKRTEYNRSQYFAAFLLSKLCVFWPSFATNDSQGLLKVYSGQKNELAITIYTRRVVYIHGSHFR